MGYTSDPAYNGTGMIGEDPCETCGGTGRLPLRQTCSTCAGEGTVLNEDEFEICSTCFSAGVIPIERVDAFILKHLYDLGDTIKDILEKVNEIKEVVDEL